VRERGLAMYLGAQVYHLPAWYSFYMPPHGTCIILEDSVLLT
jgi:hypothetical protein